MDTSPQALWQLKSDALDLRKKYLALVTDRLIKLCGNKYRSDWGTVKQLEQYMASYVAFMLPQMVADNPVCQVRPTADPRDTASADGTAALINMWIGQQQYKRRVLEPSAFNMLVGWGVTYRGVDLSGQDAERGLPVFSKPLDIADHFVDPNCFGYANRRVEGHCFDKTKEQLLADPMYAANAALIASLTPNSQARKRESMPMDVPNSLSKGDMVTLWQFWIREDNLIVTLVENGTGPAELRREEYFGPPEGPYGMWGAFEVPGQIYPLSPIAMWEEQSDDLNEQARGASNSSKTYKKFGVFRKANNADGKAVQTVKAGQMVGLDDPDSYKDAEIGGTSDYQIQILEQLKQRLDRNSGFNDAQRGMATGKATLGENQMAQSNSDARTQYIARRLMDSATEDLRAIGWFVHNSRDVIAKTSIEDQNSGQSRPVEIYGGAFELAEVQALIAQGMVDPAAIYGVGKDWSDYHLSIELESMQRVADPIRQKRAQDEMTMIMALVPIVVAAGGPAAALASFNWRRQLRRYGQAFNEPKYDQIVFTEYFSQLVAMAGGNPTAMPGGMPEPGQQGMGGGMPMMGGMVAGMESPSTTEGINANAMAGV